MSKKWSQKTEKLSLVGNDEFMIVDSEDSNASTKDKRVRALTILNNGPNRFAFQTVGATTQQQTFLFNSAISVTVLICAGNTGNTKGYGANMRINCTIANTPTINMDVANDFGTANASVSTTTNSVTITFTGEAGETIDWKGTYRLTSN